jgi:hypothetical protein
MKDLGDGINTLQKNWPQLLQNLHWRVEAGEIYKFGGRAQKKLMLIGRVNAIVKAVDLRHVHDLDLASLVANLVSVSEIK